MTDQNIQRIHDLAVAMMECSDLEPTSAIKQAASDEGVDWGDDMKAVVNAVWRLMFNEERPTFGGAQ